MTNQNWGGARQGAGRRPKYVRIPKMFYAERSERQPLTPASDLTICLAETEVDENDIRRGVVIDEVWYGRDEALALAEFVKKHRKWLVGP